MASFKQFVAEAQEEDVLDTSEMKPVVISPGRFNPPHLGHKLMIDELIKLGKAKNAEPVVIVVDSGKRDAKNPLDGSMRKQYLEKMFDGVRICIAKNPYDAVDQMKEAGSIPVGGVTGSDRADSYKKMVGRVFGSSDVADNYVAHILTRDPDGDDVKGISASKVREAAAAGDRSKVRAMTGLNDDEARELIEKMKEHLS